MTAFGMPFLLETPEIEDAARLCAELGLSFVELNMNFPACQTDKLDPQLLYRLRRKYGVYFTLHLPEDFDPFSFAGPVRRAWMAVLRDALTLAQATDMPIVNMHLPKGVYITLPGEKVFLYERYAQEYAAAVEVLRDACARMLEGSGVRMAVENTGGFAPHERRAIRMLLQSDVFGLTMDIGHSHAAEGCDEPFFREMDGRLIHMHGHDARGSQCHLALGDGDIDLAERFAWAGRRDARVVLETKTITALRESVARLPRWTGEK